MRGGILCDDLVVEPRLGVDPWQTLPDGACEQELDVLPELKKV
jgi:hypothetical protein